MKFTSGRELNGDVNNRTGEKHEIQVDKLRTVWRWLILKGKIFNIYFRWIDEILCTLIFHFKKCFEAFDFVAKKCSILLHDLNLEMIFIISRNNIAHIVNTNITKISLDYINKE